jgi:spoIIIJ-associated protein
MMNSEVTDTMALAKVRLEELVSFLGANVDAKADLTDDGIELNIESSSVSPRLIGHRGETLRAIEYLVNQIVKHGEDPEAPRILVDIAGYRAARRQSLQEMAAEIAARVKETGAEEELKPMNPAERRIVHMALREIEGVETESRGADRDRRIVVKPSA